MRATIPGLAWDGVETTSCIAASLPKSQVGQTVSLLGCELVGAAQKLSPRIFANERGAGKKGVKE